MAMKTKEIQENLVKTMRNWQGVERKSIASTGAVIGKTTSPLTVIPKSARETMSETKWYHISTEKIRESVSSSASRQSELTSSPAPSRRFQIEGAAGFTASPPSR